MKKKLTVTPQGAMFLDGRARFSYGKFTDAHLEQVATMPELRFVRDFTKQPVTKLPPFAKVERLELGDLAKLKSLAGLETMVSLQELKIEWLDRYPDLFERLRELPELVRLELDGRESDRLAPGIEKLPSLFALTLSCGPMFDLESALEQFAKIKTLRLLTLNCDREIPDVFDRFGHLTRLGIGTTGKVPPSVWKLTKLEVFRIRSADKVLPKQLGTWSALTELDASLSMALTSLPPELAKLTKLSVLKVPYDMKAVPKELYGRTLEFSGPDELKKHFKEPAPGDADFVRIWSPNGEPIPADFGQPRELEIRCQSPDLPQLARCTRVTKLVIGGDDLANVVPHIPPQLTALSLDSEQRIPELPDLPKLEQLTIYSREPQPFDVSALTTLRTLVAGGLGCKVTGLDKTKLEKLELSQIDAWVPEQLSALPLKELDLSACFELDVARLCRALEGVPIETLSLPKSVTELPAELAQLTSLRSLTIANIAVDKNVLPEGKWHTNIKKDEKLLWRDEVVVNHELARGRRRLDARPPARRRV